MIPRPPSGLQERVTLCWGGAAPFPVNTWVTVELAPSLENESMAEAVPAVDGLKVTVKEFVSPAARVAGKESPVSENSLLSIMAAEKVTDDPVAPRLPFSEALVPTTTLPKVKGAGEIKG